MGFHACNKFDLGSDHRAVYAQLSFETRGRVKRTINYVQAKRAKPEWDENNTQHDYHVALSQGVSDKQFAVISDLEEIVRTAVPDCDKGTAHITHEMLCLTPPWRQSFFQQ